MLSNAIRSDQKLSNVSASYQMLSNEIDMTVLAKAIKYKCSLSNDLHLFA